MRLPRHVHFILVCVACTAGDSARLDVEPDTLALYGKDDSWVTVQRVDAAGATEEDRASLTARDKSIVRTRGTSVACLREGTTTIDVAAEQLATTFVANCRIPARVEVESYLELEPGGAQSALAATAIFSSGESKVLHPINARVNDTTVAAVRNGAVVPLRIGHAGMRIDYGGLWVRMGVLVRRTISNDTVTLGSGEQRVWRLEPGRYTMTVNVASPRDLNILDMQTAGLRCSRDSRDGDRIHCVADEPAEVTFQNTSSGRTARTGRAFVSIIQMPRDRTG